MSAWPCFVYIVKMIVKVFENWLNKFPGQRESKLILRIVFRMRWTEKEIWGKRRKAKKHKRKPPRCSGCRERTKMMQRSIWTNTRGVACKYDVRKPPQHRVMMSLTCSPGQSLATILAGEELWPWTDRRIRWHSTWGIRLSNAEIIQFIHLLSTIKRRLAFVAEAFKRSQKRDSFMSNFFVGRIGFIWINATYIIQHSIAGWITFVKWGKCLLGMLKRNSNLKQLLSV